MLILFILIHLIFARSKRLDIREIKKEIVSIVRLVYYMLVDNYMYINMFKIERNSMNYCNKCIWANST